jgi:hypothetical protein
LDGRWIFFTVWASSATGADFVPSFPPGCQFPVTDTQVLAGGTLLP